MSTISFKTFSGSLSRSCSENLTYLFKIFLAKTFFLSNYKMPFLEIEKEIPMNPRQMHFINILVVAYGRIDILNLSGFWSLKWITMKRRVEIPAIFISRHYINTRKGENGHIDICVSSCLLNMFLMCGNDWTCNEMI